MDVLSLIKQSLINDSSNPITKHFELGRQAASGGPEMVWKIFDATRIKDKTVSGLRVLPLPSTDIPRTQGNCRTRVCVCVFVCLFGRVFVSV